MTMEFKHMDGRRALLEVVGEKESGMVYRAGRFISCQVCDRHSAILAESAEEDSTGSKGHFSMMSAKSEYLTAFF